MNKPLKTFVSWSSGKDAALSLYHLKRNPHYDVQGLLSAVNAHHDRVSMHGLRRSLLEQQIKATGLPSFTVELPEQPGMEEYERKTGAALERLHRQGFTHAAFGDIFLEDLRDYRINQLNKTGLTGVFPVWKRNSAKLIGEFIHLGFKAIVVCVKAELLDQSFAGRHIDQSFLSDLPENVDPCGENGEFHTFCYDGPIFESPVAFEVGEKVYKEYKSPSGEREGMGFWFCDLLPVTH